MTDAMDPDLAALADLAAELAELLRFEHDAGAIGVVSGPASRPALPITAVPLEGKPPAAEEPAPPRAPKAAKPRATAPSAARPVEVSMGDIDALLAQAKRARPVAEPGAGATPQRHCPRGPRAGGRPQRARA